MAKTIVSPRFTQKIFLFTVTSVLCATLLAWLLYQRSTSYEPLKALDSNDLKSINLNLVNGNMIVLIRHTERCDRSASPCLLGAEGLSIKGQEDALYLAKQLASWLKGSAFDVFNSPTLRTRQTANALFQERSRDQTWLRKNCKETLFDNIVKNKQAGKNLVLVTHSTCLRELNSDGRMYLNSIDFSQDKSYGISIFFRFDATTAALIPVGYVYLDDWTQKKE